MEQKYIKLLQALIATPRVSREEGKAVDILQAWLQAEGLQPRRIGNNLWCPPKEEKGLILLNAHIDTVRPAATYTRDPYVPTLEGDVLYGLGSNDDGGSLIALLAAYMRLREQGLADRLIFSATAEEEVSGRGGLEMILPELGEVVFGMIGEPTGMQMAVAEKGLMVLDCTAHGRSGHAAREEGDNALYRALDDINWIRHYRFEQDNEYLGPVKMTATMIECGTQHNVVPDSCRFVVDVRPNGEYSNEEVLAVIREHLKSEVQARSTRLNSSKIALTHPVVVEGLKMGLKAYGSPTMSNQVLCPFPTLKMGPGESARSHTADEYIRISEIEKAIDIYETLGQRLLRR